MSYEHEQIPDTNAKVHSKYYLVNVALRTTVCFYTFLYLKFMSLFQGVWSSWTGGCATQPGEHLLMEHPTGL
jgi:hypothetical protein